jgi:hypothetical protein
MAVDRFFTNSTKDEENAAMQFYVLSQSKLLSAAAAFWQENKVIRERVKTGEQVTTERKCEDSYWAPASLSTAMIFESSVE